MLALACSSSLACLRPLRALRAEQSLSTQVPSGGSGGGLCSARNARRPRAPPSSTLLQGARLNHIMQVHPGHCSHFINQPEAQAGLKSACARGAAGGSDSGCRLQEEAGFHCTVQRARDFVGQAREGQAREGLYRQAISNPLYRQELRTERAAGADGGQGKG